MADEKIIVTRKTSNFRYVTILLALFTTVWVASNISSVKLVSIFGITLTGGFFTFPFATIFGNVISEVYGYKNMRQAIWLGVIVNITFISCLYLVYLLPSSPHWHLNDEFKAVLFSGARIIFASISSYFVAEFVNSYLMARLKIYSDGKSLFLRIFSSCAISFLLDIVLFLTLAFYGRLPNDVLMTLIFSAYLKKVVCQILLYPFAYALISHLKRKEGVDVYDYDTDFTPFAYDNIYDIRSYKAYGNNENSKSSPGLLDHSGAYH